MKIEIGTAYAVGALLPILETIRRGFAHWTVNFTTMFEDYLAGLLLLIGAWAAHRDRRWGPSFLLAAWAYVTGMMGGSFWWHLEATLRGEFAEPNNAVVLGFKLALWGTCVLSLVLAYRRATAAHAS